MTIALRLHYNSGMAKLTDVLQIRVTRAERLLVKRAAKRCGYKTSAWSRQVLLSAASLATAPGFVRPEDFNRKPVI